MDDLLERYRRDGCCVVPSILTADEVAALRAAVERVYRGELDGEYVLGPPFGIEDPDAVKTLMYGWRVSDAVRRLAFDPRITSIAAGLLGTDRVRLWQDQVIWKPPARDGERGAAGNIGWHQDYAYWQDGSSSEAMLTANVVLQDNAVTNGAMRVLTGSHQLGLLSGADAFFRTDLDELRAELDQRTSVALDDLPVEMPAGSASFHHSLAVHGSGPNRSSQPRLAIALAYFADGLTIRAHEGPMGPHTRALLPDPQPGQAYGGPGFPLVWDGGPVSPDAPQG